MAGKGKVAELIGAEGGGAGRERRSSLGNIDLAKKKRERVEMEETEKGVMSAIKRIQRSPVKNKLEKMREELKAELRMGIQEMKEMVRTQLMESRMEIEEMKRH